MHSREDTAHVPLVCSRGGAGTHRHALPGVSSGLPASSLAPWSLCECRLRLHSCGVKHSISRLQATAAPPPLALPSRCCPSLVTSQVNYLPPNP